MFNRLNERLGVKTGNIEDLILFNKIVIKSTDSFTIYRGVKHYHKVFCGKYWSKSKAFAAYYSGREGYLLSADVPSLIDKSPWVMDSINYSFPDNVVSKFKIRYEKVKDSKFI